MNDANISLKTNLEKASATFLEGDRSQLIRTFFAFLIPNIYARKFLQKLIIILR
jgi:hypothetical protein